nr:hypothetical protein [Tanacetum cinerariifolium]
MIVAQQVGEGVAEVHVEEVSTAGVAAEGAASAADDEVPAVIDEPSIPSPPPSAQPPPTSQDIPSTSQDARVKKLGRRNKLKASKLRRLKKVGTTQKVETFDDTVIDDISKQGRIIADMDADKDVIMKDVAAVAKDVQDAEIEKRSDVQGRQAELQAQIYQIDLEHADKVLSMQDVDIEPAELQEVVDVVTTAKLITEVVTAASTTITAAALQLTTAAPILTTAPNKGKGIMVEEPKTLKKQAQIKQDEAYARELKAELNKNIDWDEMEEEDSRSLKRLSESQEDKAAKKQKLDEEVAELKRHLQLVPNDEDDVYTKATPLARKVPVVDYEIYTEKNKPYYKIIRADGSLQLFLSFLSLLRNFDREDLEVLWELVKERFASSKPKNFSGDFLLTTLTYMFEKPNVQAQMILLVERRYPLSRFTLDQLINNVRLKVEEESEVSLELLRFIRQQQQEGFRAE